MPKAGRLGDIGSGHGCFPPTPIIAGSSDTFINGKPAARKDDAVLLHACPCPYMPHGVHGRAIAAGSCNVSINGKPAARIGDAINCGGSVSTGSGDTFIGEIPYKSPSSKCAEAAAKKAAPLMILDPMPQPAEMLWGASDFFDLEKKLTRKARYESRKALAASGAGKPETAAASERLAFNNDNIIRAEAAQYVYKVDEFKRGHISELPPAPEGLNLIDPQDVPGMENAVFNDKNTGFGAALFKSDINGETMLTYRGTNNGVTGKQDWKTNLMQGMGKETDQYNQAMELAEKTQRAVGDDFSIVGHSLGGGLASSGVAVTGQPGYTFNAAGLHPDTPARKGGLSLEETSKLIQTQSVKGEVLTLAQENANTAITGGLTALGNKLGGPVGASIGLAIGSFLVPKVPEAVGSKRDLPGSGMNPVARHGMDQVIDGIESQKKEDIKTLLSG